MSEEVEESTNRIRADSSNSLPLDLLFEANSFDSPLELRIPPDGGWGWFVVLASFMASFTIDGIAYHVPMLIIRFILLISLNLGFSFGVYVDELSTYFGVSRATTALANSMMTGLLALMAPIVSGLINKYGFRPLALIGSLICTIAFLVCVAADNFVVFVLTYSVMGGIGMSLVLFPAFVAVNYYFERRRAMATGIAVSGSGVGTIVLPLFCRYLIATYAWQGSLWIMAGFLLNGAVVGFLLRPLPKHRVHVKMAIHSPPLEPILEEDEQKNEAEESLPSPKNPSRQISVVSRIRSDFSRQISTTSKISYKSRAKSPDLQFHQIIRMREANRKVSEMSGVSEISGIYNETNQIKSENLSPKGGRSISTVESPAYPQNHSHESLPVLESGDELEDESESEDKSKGESKLMVGDRNVEVDSTKGTRHENEHHSPLRSDHTARARKTSTRKGHEVKEHGEDGLLLNQSDGHQKSPAPRTISIGQSSILFGSHEKLSMSRRPSVHRLISRISIKDVMDPMVLSRLSSVKSFMEAKDFSKPFSRADIMYPGSVQNLAEFIESGGDVELYRENTIQVPSKILYDEDANTVLAVEEIAPRCRFLPRQIRNVFVTIFDFHLLANPVMLVLLLSNAFGMLAFYVPFVFLIDRARTEFYMEESQATWLLSIIGITNTIGRILFGILSDRRFMSAIALNNYCLLICGIITLMVPLFTNFGFMSFYAAVFGFFLAGYVSLTSIILVDFFGLQKLTNAFGLLVLIRGAFSMIGAPSGGLVLDLTGSYDISFAYAGILLLISAFISFMIPFVAEKRYPFQKRSALDPDVVEPILKPVY